MDLSTAQGIYLGATGVQSVYLGSTIIWPTTPHDYSQDYFTIVSLEDNNTIYWKNSLDTSFTKTISASSDGGNTWSSYTSSQAGTTLATLNTGDKLLIKGNNTTYSTGLSYAATTFFAADNYINVEGNIMSLIYGDNFINQTSLPYDERDIFSGIFRSMPIISAKDLILPATELSMFCYEGMFFGCTSLIAAPELPATTLFMTNSMQATSCYEYMFSGCTNLTIAPELPAITISSRCYAGMFSGCKKLTTVQAILPATTLAVGCYYGMYSECQQLVNAPELPATTLQRQCYIEMFKNCTSLNYIKCLATTIGYDSEMNEYATNDWVYHVSLTGTFVKDANATWPTLYGCGIPSGWTVQNAA